ncbi:MAG: nicotinamide-nucleotide adenylyltransferase [Thermofilum sp.]
MSRGLFIGRFQPFHKGHLEAVKWILEREEELVIGVGSAQYAYLPKNPFTAGERLLMIWSSLKVEGLLDRVIITLIPDTDSVHFLWPAYVEMMSPKFDRAYSNDPLTQALLRERGYEVVGVPLKEREVLSGTHVRNLMAQGDEDWRNLVPEAVAKILDQIGGEGRVRTIYKLHGLL